MATVTLVQPARHDATRIIQMIAHPGGIVLANLAAGPMQFNCTNALESIKQCTSVEIVYDAQTPGALQEKLQISSVIS